MKNKHKLRDFITVFLIQLVLVLPFYTLEAYGLAISNARVTNVEWNSATIAWDTDVASNSRIRYGTSAALGLTQSQSNFVTSHSVTASGLSSQTLYYFSVESTDSTGSTVVENNNNKLYNFTTLDITPPARPTGLNAVLRRTTSVSLAWNNVNDADLAYYKIFRNNVFVATSAENKFNDTGLAPNTQYQYRVLAADTSGNEGFQSDTLIVSTPELDTTEPSVSDVYVLLLTDTTARITWLTNENATSSVLYGIDSANQAAANNTYTLNHSITLTNLVRDSNYTFTINSCDLSNNCAALLSQNFISRQDTTAPFINLELPLYLNRRVIDIVGFTEPFSQVRLFVNDLGIPRRILGPNDVGASGIFSFSNVQLQDSNQIKIESIDQSNNRNEAFFEVSVDIAEPAVDLDDTISLATSRNLTIKGTVNEPVTVKVFVDPAQAQPSPPSKITGLKTTSIGANSVEIEWNQYSGNEFSHYAVYRNNAAIATAKPSSYNSFIDALADSGAAYSYRVSAVNIYGQEGAKSDPLPVTTLQGGSALNLQYPPVDIFDVTRVPDVEFSAEGSFEFGVQLGNADGVYNLKLIFEDIAQNRAVIEDEIILDTKKPVIEVTSPPNGALIYENVANSIDIVGITDPNSRVHLYVDRTPFSSYDTSVQVTGLANEIQSTPEQRLEIDINELSKWLENSSITEEELESNCGAVASGAGCRGSDKSVTADTQGNFKFENVDMTALFAAAARLRNVPLTAFRDDQLNQEARNSRRVFLVVIATDPAGLHGFKSQRVNIGSCWSGNQSWDVISLTQYQTPFALSTERMREGTEAIYFYFNYSYIGRGVSPRITSISLQKACGNLEIIDPRYNISCKVLPSGGTATPIGPLGRNDFSTTYSAVPLNRFADMDRFTGDDFKSFFKALGNEMAFPFKVRITYDHDIIDSATGQSKKIRETQTTCQEVSYIVDRDVIDPRNVLPDWVLYDFVDFLDDSIKTLTDVQQQIDKVVNYVAIGCLVSFGANLVTKIYRKVMEFNEEKVRFNPIVNAVTGIAGLNEFKLIDPITNQRDPIKEQECSTLRDQVKAAHNGNLKLKYFTDADLQKCFPSVYGSWQNEEKFYKLMRYSCDRIFGHSSPSKWTENRDDTELYRRLSTRQRCANDQSVAGFPLRAVRCLDVDLTAYGARRDEFNQNDKCFEVQTGRETVLLKLGNRVENSNNIYRLLETRPGRRAYVSYAIQDGRSENSFITASPRSCEELCGIRASSNAQQDTVSVENGQVRLIQTSSSGDEGAAPCLTVNTCKSLIGNRQFIDSQGTVHEIKSVYTAGYASKISGEDDRPCFYNGDNPNVVSDFADTRRECCCIKTNEQQGPITQYYQPYDAPKYQSQNPVHQLKTDPTVTANKLEEMKWSYRYSRIGFTAQGTDGVEHNQYNPNRYIEGRDFPACFGQDHALYRATQRRERVLTLNPFRNQIAAVQCLHLTGVSQRLQLYKNIMNSLSNCLIEVRTSGKADAGVCKDLFTQHVCGLIWQIIQFFNNRDCDLDDTEINTGRDRGAEDSLTRGFRGITQGISEAQQELTQEYGNARVSNLLGTGTESVSRKICLAAFGYDWEFNARNLIDAAYTTPFATLVQAVTRSREFLTVDPIRLTPKYEYRASWLINPGCDLERYNVELACVSRKEMDEYPNAIKCDGIDCDCLGLTQEQLYPFFSKGNLKQNELEEQDRHLAIPLDRRYDHLKFTLRTDRRIPANVQQNCFPTGYEKGVFYFPLRDRTARDITDCHVDYLSGLYVCTGGLPFAEPTGTAELLEVTINDNRADQPGLTANVGETLNVRTRIRNTGKDKCLRILVRPDGTGETQVVEPIYQQGEIDTGNIQVTTLGITNIRAIEHPGLNRENIDVIGTPTNPAQIIIGLLFESDDQVFSFTDENDYLSVYGQRKKITEWLTNGEIIIPITGANINIKINPPINLNPTRTGNKYTLTVSITIPGQQIAQTTQNKQVSVGIFNLKNNVEALVNPAADCNFNNPVVERTYNIVVNDRNVVLIQQPTIDPTNIQVDNRVNISVVINTFEGISGITEAKISFRKPDGNLMFEPPADMIRNGDHFEWVFTTDGFATGQYSFTIQARSRTGQPGSRTFTFNINPATNP